MSTDSSELIRYVHEIFADFDTRIDQLSDFPNKVKKKTKTLLKLFRKKDIFGDAAGDFEDALDELNDEVGHAGWEVLEIELRRQGVIKSEGRESPVQLPQNPKEVNPQTLINVGEQAQKGGGWTGLFASNRWAKVMENYMKWHDNRLKMTPDIATGKEVLDILEFGRQLRPEINATIDYYRRAKDHLFFFHDENTRERFNTELWTHLMKITGIIRAFTQTSVDHRIDNVEDRKRAVATSIIALIMAQYSAMGEMTQADWMKALKRASGPTDVGS